MRHQLNTLVNLLTIWCFGGDIILINSVRKYMVVDFIMLGVIGFLLEFLCQRFGYMVIPAAPFSYISMLIVFMLVARWNLWGLVIAPLLALATILGGKLCGVNDIAAVYDWRAYVSIVCGFMTFGVNVAFYRKNTNRVISSILSFFLLIILDYVLFNIMQVIVYRLLTSGSVFARGVYEVANSKTGEIVNVYIYGERGLVYNLFALVVMFAGGYVFRSQGVICNVRQKFIDDKRNAELDRLDENFTIDDSEESAISEDVENSSNPPKDEALSQNNLESDEVLNDCEKDESKDSN